MSNEQTPFARSGSEVVLDRVALGAILGAKVAIGIRQALLPREGHQRFQAVRQALLVLSLQRMEGGERGGFGVVPALRGEGHVLLGVDLRRRERRARSR